MEEPRVVLHPAQFRHDAGDRRAHDRLADRGGEHPDQESVVDPADPGEFEFGGRGSVRKRVDPSSGTGPEGRLWGRCPDRAGGGGRRMVEDPVKVRGPVGRFGCLGRSLAALANVQHGTFDRRSVVAYGQLGWIGGWGMGGWGAAFRECSWTAGRVVILIVLVVRVVGGGVRQDRGGTPSDPYGRPTPGRGAPGRSSRSATLAARSTPRNTTTGSRTSGSPEGGAHLPAPGPPAGGARHGWRGRGRVGARPPAHRPGLGGAGGWRRRPGIAARAAQPRRRAGGRAGGRPTHRHRGR